MLSDCGIDFGGGGRAMLSTDFTVEVLQLETGLTKVFCAETVEILDVVVIGLLVQVDGVGWLVIA